MSDEKPFMRYLRDGGRVCRTYSLFHDFYKYQNLDFQDDAFLEDTLDQLDSLAESVLDEFNAPLYLFVMNPDCFEYMRCIIDEIKNNRKISVNIQYNVETKNAIPYILQIHMHSVSDGSCYEMESVLLRWNVDSERLEMFDNDHDSWISDDNIQKVYQAVSRSSPEATFLFGLEDYTQRSVYMMKLDQVCDILDSNRKLISLAESLHEVGCLKLYIEYTMDDGQFKEQNLRMILTANDHRRHGACVFYDYQGDNMFHICQMLLIHEEDRQIVARDLNRHLKHKDYLFDDIAQTDDSDKLLNLLLSMWDHFNCCHDWYTFPISSRSFLNFRSDLDPDFTPHIAFGDSELTGKEKNEIEDLKEIMLADIDA